MKQNNGDRNQYRAEHHSRGMMRQLTVAAGWLLCAAAFVAGGLTVLGISGKYNLKQQTMSYAAGTGKPVRTITATTDTEEEPKKGQNIYPNREYRYNEDILTFLFMGIDREDGAKADEGYAGGGQADALFLFVLNPHEETMSLIPINRSTMTEVDVYDGQGNYENTVTAQVCAQYGFGDGGRESCEYQIKAVSNLFYGIPIHGYLAVDLGVVPAVTEMIDGVDLSLFKDIQNGDQSEDRQRQLAAALIGEVRRMTGKDLTVPIKIYNKVSDKAVTDITVDEVTYLTAKAGGYHFDERQVFTVPGTSINGEGSGDDVLDEFYVDETAFYKLILDVFYEPADEE